MRGIVATVIIGKAFIEGRIVDNVTIEINDLGIITKISKGTFKGRSKEETFNFLKNGLLILPGAIDIHTHMRDFKESYKEDFYSGTSAAAAGGVTIVADMPNTKPKTNTLPVLEMRDKVASEKSVVDYALYYGVPNVKREVMGFERKAIGVKVYPENLFHNCREVFEELMKYVSSKNILTVFHAENPYLFKNDERPLDAEISGAVKVLELHKKYRIKAHITHVTTSYIVELVKHKGNITIDTCPHYLLLNKEFYLKNKYFRVNPPLRSKVVQENLLKTLSLGKIDAITTDHAPHSSDEKFSEKHKPGFPGLETALPLLLTLTVKNIIGLKDVVKLYSSNPARILELHRYVGKIREDVFANLVVVDLSEEYTVNSKTFFSKAKHSPFNGWKVRGKVKATFVRGKPVFIDGEIVSKKGYGINVKKYGGVFENVS
ncbi:MAG: hypothetical protein DRO23_01635 [Thermoprotei archaeon]|nr:MAG: hypothetical protein DRO23_01635 [Thermoprotei archaeon]